MSSTTPPSLTYIQVHLYYIIPPILLLGYLYKPLFGRRDAIKVGWLMFMATCWTTPWDNWIISRSAWSYPPQSILFKINHVPFEEHLFFIFQPILLVLIQALIGLPRAIPFEWKDKPRVGEVVVGGKERKGKREEEVMVQTLPRRPWIGLGWMGLCLVGAVGLFFSPATTTTTIRGIISNPSLISSPTTWNWTINEGPYFYLSSILIWISPVLALLTTLGAKVEIKQDWYAWALGTGYLWMVDSIAIRAGAWAIDEQRTLGWVVWKGLPIEEAFFFAVVSYLLVLASSLINHLHFLLLLAPPPPPPPPPPPRRSTSTSPSHTTPRCPPANPLSHIVLLTRLALDPPLIPHRLLLSLETSEMTLRQGSKSFSVAKLGWSREMRCGLIVVYGWCRVTDDLIDDDHVDDVGQDKGDVVAKRKQRLAMMRRFLDLVYAGRDGTQMDEFFENEVPTRAHSAFYLFSRIIVDLVPRTPFDDLLDGYQMDLDFPDQEALKRAVEKIDDEDELRWDQVSPIQSQADLILYADRVAGSVADMILHLTWNILTSEPVTRETSWALSRERKETLRQGRKMGQALQLVNIARDVRTDAESIGRIYIPMEWFKTRGRSGKHQLRSLANNKETADEPFEAPRYTLPLLHIADGLRTGSANAIETLPWTARAGTRAMVVSYFEIGQEVRRRGGQAATLKEGRLRVSKRRRLLAVLWSIWGW